MAIHELMKAAYEVEATLIRAVDFPPLQRTSEQIASATTQFFGVHQGEKLVAVVEVNSNCDPHWFDAVAVHPHHFRKGLATQLLHGVQEQFPGQAWRVQTSVKNQPALQLYRQLGFRLQRRFRTDCGYDMVVLQHDS